MRYRLTFSTGTAGRMGPDDAPCREAGQNGRFGFWWFYWLPIPRYNGGRWARREVLDLTVNWLCYWCAITAWPTGNGKWGVEK